MITKIRKHILFLGIIAIFLIIPFPVSAIDPFTALWRAVVNIPGDIVGAIIGFLILISMAFTSLTGGILDFVISPSFVEWGYTQNNPIIAIGLGITKQFVNMGLVAILITISFLVTLRIKEYDAKKLLVNLIIIALLVNFAPVLVGLIVDASNIMMSYFLSGISKGVSGVFGQGGGSALMQDIKTLTMGTWAQQSSILLKGLVFIIINLILTIILFIYSGLFVCRYMALWILTILSPLAFISWILPATRKFWTMWWNQVIKWSIVGITAGFFLYLSVTTFGYINSYYSQPKIVPPGMDSTFFSSILAYIMIITFMIIGLIYGAKAGDSGASMALGATRKSEAWLRKKTAKGVGSYLADARTLGKIQRRTEEEKIASGRGKLDPRRYFKGSRMTTREAAEGVARRWDKIPIARVFRPEALEKFGQHKEAYDRTGGMGGPTEFGVERIANGKVKGAEAARYFVDTVKERGDSQDVISYFGKLYKHEKEGPDGTKYIDEEALLNDPKFINNKQLNNVMGYLSRSGKRGTVERMDSRFAIIGHPEVIEKEDMSEEARKEARKARVKLMMKRIIDSKPQDVSGQEREVHENEQVMEIAMAVGGEDYLRALMNQKGGAAIKKYTMENIYSQWIESSPNRSTSNDKDTRAKNNKDFWEFLGKEYGVTEPPMQKALENKNIRSKLGLDDIGFSYKDKIERTKKPGTVIDAITSDAPSGPTEPPKTSTPPPIPETQQRINKDKEWIMQRSKNIEKDKQSRIVAENAEKMRRAMKNKKNKDDK